MDSYDQFLPPDLTKMVETYQKENNSCIKFIKLLAENDRFFVWWFQVKMDKIMSWVEDRKLPIEVRLITSRQNGSVRITGELPVIGDTDFRLLILAMAEGGFQLGLLNWLLMKSESSLRIITSVKDFCVNDADSTEHKAYYQETYSIIEIK